MLLQWLRTWRARRAFSAVRHEVYESIGNSMLKDGVPLRTCLTKLVARASKDGDPLAALYSKWLRRMGDARTRGEFTACVKDDIPQTDYMVLVGFERAGKLAEGLVYQAGLIRRMRKMRSEFVLTLVKPGIAVTAAILLSAFFSSVTKNFLDVFPMEKWSALAQIMFRYTLFVGDHLLLIVLGLFALTGAFVWSLPNWGGALRHRLDNYLPYVVYRDYMAFSTLVVLASLLSSGTPLKVAAQQILNTGSNWIQSYFRKIVRRLGDARIRTPAEAFDVGFFPKRIYYRLLDASEQGDFHAAVRRIAEDGFDAMEQEMKKRGFILDQLSYLVAGGVMGLVAGGLAFAIMDLRALVSSL